MRRNRNAKIIATLGPASNSPDMLEALFVAGIDVFRLNFSHGAHEDHAKTHANLRDLENKTGRPIAILMDLHCLLYTSPSPRDRTRSRMPSSA